ncbi:MAG: ammonium transporter [Thermodesulfobacteriota bacteirum]|nr:ammonium transporter [Thermodesulfobacteriota bacterium]
MFKNKTKNFSIFIFLSILSVLSVNNASASNSPDETAFVFNTLLFLICGFLVMWMAAGFAMLESGMVRSKNVSTICLKNVGLYSISGIMFYIVGYNLAYGIPEGGYIGSFTSFAAAEDLATGYAAHSDWFFQMVFCATTVSIVSGTIAERIKIWPFFIFAAILAGIIYPIEMGWQWGGGWLSSMGFSDFAGSTLVHAAGGAAALAGAIIIGPRIGRFGKDGTSTPIPASSIPLATLGTFILWLGWFGFNGGSQLAMGSKDDVNAIANVILNTNMAACAGAVITAILTQILYKKVDLTLVLNGALAGLVSITAGPDYPTMMTAILIGAIGAGLCTLAIQIFDKVRIDDPVGALSVHGVCGLFGLLVVPMSNDGASYMSQLYGAAVIFGFVFVSSWIVWSIIKVTMGIRVTAEQEDAGMDLHDCGVEAYPEFKD